MIWEWPTQGRRLSWSMPAKTSHFCSRHKQYLHSPPRRSTSVYRPSLYRRYKSQRPPCTTRLLLCVVAISTRGKLWARKIMIGLGVLLSNRSQPVLCRLGVTLMRTNGKCLTWWGIVNGKAHSCQQTKSVKSYWSQRSLTHQPVVSQQLAQSSSRTLCCPRSEIDLSPEK